MRGLDIFNTAMAVLNVALALGAYPKVQDLVQRLMSWISLELGKIGEDVCREIESEEGSTQSRGTRRMVQLYALQTLRAVLPKTEADATDEENRIDADNESQSNGEPISLRTLAGSIREDIRNLQSVIDTNTSALEGHRKGLAPLIRSLDRLMERSDRNEGYQLIEGTETRLDSEPQHRASGQSQTL
ncbi:hypothetical protein FQN54_006044 [Arachnomyces sp. PD_36]|nr:hypothetical protein FQN54_006044 [Arachnomyces sp. PD_36]